MSEERLICEARFTPDGASSSPCDSSLVLIDMAAKIWHGDFEKARKQLNSGRRMSPKEYQFLDGLALFCHPGVFVDIGAWMGFSTRVIANALIRGKLEGFVLAIDPQTLDLAGKHKPVVEQLGLTSTDIFLEANLVEWGIEERVVVITERSQEVAREIPNGIASLVMIDGSHKRVDVTEDFLRWLPKLRRGGFLAFHDYEHIPGPTHVVDELVKPQYVEGNFLSYAGRVGWLIAFKKEK